jgi:hypothetical protein
MAHNYSRSLALLSSNLIANGGSLSFACTANEGATLVMPYDGERLKSRQRDIIEQYMLAYRSQWLSYANHPDRGFGVDIDDLILVESCIKTVRWAMTVFTERMRDVSVDFTAGGASTVSIKASAGAKRKTKIAPVHHSGPTQLTLLQEPGPSNQRRRRRRQVVIPAPTSE